MYDNFSAHSQLISFFYLILIYVQVVAIVDAIPRSCSCHIKKYGDVVDSFNNMMVNNLIAEYSEFLVQWYDTYGGPTRKGNDLFLGVTMSHGLSLGNFQFGCLILTYHPGEEYWFKCSGTFNLSNVILPFDFVNSIHIARSVPRGSNFREYYAYVIYIYYRLA